MLARLVRATVRRARPRLVNHSLTDAPFVQELRRAADVEAVVAVYDDGTAPHVTPGTLERELGVSVSRDRELRLPSLSLGTFGPVQRTVRARTLADADPPVVLLSRRSLEAWDDRTRNFVLAHEFGHLRTGPPVADEVVASLSPMPDRSALAIRALAAARDEYRAGEAHAAIRDAVPERHRTPSGVMAEYHAAERTSEDATILDPTERRALAIRNAAKYFPLPYEPPDVGEGVRTALDKPLPQYVDAVRDGRVTVETSA